MRNTVFEFAPCLISGLNPATRYYVAVKQVCEGSEESDWSEPVDFLTAHVIIFNETFMLELIVLRDGAAIAVSLPTTLGTPAIWVII